MASAVRSAPSLPASLATADANPNLDTNLAGVVGKTLWLEQIKAIGLTMALAIGGTFVVAMAVKKLIGLRPDPDSEEDGLDQLDHGEAGYHLDEAGGLAAPHGLPASLEGVTAVESGERAL